MNNPGYDLAVIHVHGEADPDRDECGRLRTEGLAAAGHPELTLTGIPESLAAPAALLLEQAAQALLEQRDPPLPLVSENRDDWLLSLAYWAIEAEPPAVRRQAADALAERDGPAAFERLIEICLRDPDAELRRHVACLVQTVDAALATERMIAALGEAELTVARQASDVLEQHQDPDNLARLLAALSDPQPQVRWMVAEVLGRIYDPGSVEALIAALDDPQAKVRGAVAWSLGELADPAAAPALIRVLSDESGETRACAARALAEIGDAQATSALIGLLEDDFVPARRWASCALSRVADAASASEPLIAALADDDAEVRQNAARGLGDWRVARAVGPLIGLLDDPDTEARWTAIDALGELGDAQALEPLLGLLSGQEQGGTVILALIEACERLGAAARLPALLVALLAHPELEARQHASDGLCRLPAEASVPLLVDHLGNTDFTAEQRVYAIPALCALADPRAIAPLRALLEGDEPDWLQDFARKALEELAGD